MAWGTLEVNDTLESLRVVDGTVAEIGEDRVWQAIEAAFVAHNRIVTEIIRDFCDVSTERLRRSGGVDTVTMEELSEHGVPQAQQVTAGELCGAPLRKYGAGMQWTRDYFMIAQTREIAAQVTSIFSADMRNIGKQIKDALFKSTNYNYTDRYIDSAVLPVKRLINADSFPIPPKPDGSSFDTSTHTHYNASAIAGGWGAATAAQKTTDAEARITDVVEHYESGKLYVYINQAEEDDFRTLTGFVAYLDARVTGATSSDQATGKSLDVVNVYNRAIGLFKGAEVWVKPWVPASYVFCFNADQPKPLWVRVRGSGKDGTAGPVRGVIGQGAGNNISPFGDLYLVSDNEMYPLRAKQYVREFGVAVWNRVNGAILYTGNNAYTAPTFTA